jgi:putative ABC transport system permease protein
MIRHSLLLIYRNFKRFKNAFFINLIGLSTGLASTLLIYLWVNDELKVDKFHTNDARLFQVMESQQHSGSIRVTDSTPGLLAETLAEEMPEVEFASVATPTYWFDKFNLSVKDKNTSATGVYVSKDYFNTFSYDLIHGDADRVLADKNSIVISASVAKSLFNTTEGLIGKMVEFQHEREFMISGIFQDIPKNSTTRFGFALSFELVKEMNPGVLNWGNSGPMTFVVLKQGQDPAAFAAKIEKLIDKKVNDSHRRLFIQKYSDAYLFGEYENGKVSGGRIEYVTLFSIIAVFILLIACINFMNLSTAKASRRIKEVGIKKAVGASRRTLVMQYMSESMLMSFLSLTVSILLVDLFLPQFNLITGKQLTLKLEGNVVLSFLAITIFTGLIAGSYPALYLSGFNPVAVLKGKFNTSLGELWARKGLVIFQFAISVIFIVCVVVVYSQIRFAQNRNLGYDNENVIYFEIEGKVKQNVETFLTEMKKLPGVVNASSIGQSMIGDGNTTNVEWEGKDPNMIVPFAIRPVNYDIIEMLDLTIKQGRAFSRNFNDSAKVIINEAGIEVMGLKDPVGKEIGLGKGMKLEIIGVVKNFHFESLRYNVGPMFFVLVPQYTQKVMAKLAAGDQGETVKIIQQFYQQYNPGFDFNYRFLEQDYQEQYVAEKRVALLAEYFAGLAILISCLGLFGLAAFTAERRIKEIGIRKVLGSTEWGIVYLLTTDFTKIVCVAIIIAMPVSYLITNYWLGNFAYKIPLAWWYFVGSGFIALCIAWLTVGAQAVKAAHIAPTRCLRDE